MDFNSLLKEIKNINKKTNENTERCFICHFPINKDEKHYKLKCSHCYHANCIKIKCGHIKCPYCLTHNFGKKCKICRQYYFGNKCKNNHDEFRCKKILTRGKNKGKECSKINCKIHKDIILKKIKSLIEKEDNICKSLLKSGKRKGEICNRKNCHYHNKNKKKEINL